MTAPARHVPVLRDEALAALGLRDGGVYCDATFGAGGYTRAMLATPGVRVLALDRDPDAIRAGADLVVEMAGRLTLAAARFGDLDRVAMAEGFAALDGVVLDVGVSSMQFDEAERGFSFRFEGPLDMRMSREGRSAADIVNEAEAEEIADILFHFGEERASRRIAAAIAMDRKRAPFTTTKQLADMIARVAPGPSRDIHPATRSFQALRIAVNDELGELLRALEAAERALKPGGRLAVVTFHSLEDRIVKQFLVSRSGRAAQRSRHLPDGPSATQASFDVAPGQPVVAGAAEVDANPRARSAKLRFATRANAPARRSDDGLAKLARLPARQIRRR